MSEYPQDSYRQIADAVTGLPLPIRYDAEPPTTGYEVLEPPGEPFRVRWDAQPPTQPNEESTNG
jgi:hypothetical protein